MAEGSTNFLGKGGINLEEKERAQRKLNQLKTTYRPEK